jgi:hypothetical protein
MARLRQQSNNAGDHFVESLAWLYAIGAGESIRRQLVGIVGETRARELIDKERARWTNTPSKGSRARAEIVVEIPPDR